MSFIDVLIAIIYGIVEGITEWLPISSTGHMILLDSFLTLNVSEAFHELYLVVIQLGAIMAVVVIYWKEIWPFGIKDNKHPWKKEGIGRWVKFGIGFIVVEKWVEDKEPYVKSVDDITYPQALLIGAFQLIAAVFPGTSRSGSTIVGSLAMGISREAAAKFTFFLAIPVMMGASLLKILKYEGDVTGTEIATLVMLHLSYPG